MTRPTLILVTSTLLLLSTACGGGSSGVVSAGGGSTNLTATFVADEPNPGPNTVSFIEASPASGNIVTLQVNVTDTDNVHTAAFDVFFDAALVEYVGYSTGSFLEQGGNVPLYQVGPGPGRIVVGVNRFGNSGTNAVGSAVLMNLNFRVTAAGQSQLSVVNATLRDGNFDDIQGVAWFGGSLTGR